MSKKTIKIIIIILIAIVIAIIAIGGYYLYKRTNYIKIGNWTYLVFPVARVK